MKVDYLIQLFKSSNKKILNNKLFSYFLIALVIGFTVILRKLPQIYYKYLLNPVLLLLVVILIILIASHNYSLGIILGVCLIALYYPTQYQYQNIYLETFENETDTIPIEKTDKNIVDDEEPIKEPIKESVKEPVKEPIEKPTEKPKKANKKTDKKTDKSEESDGELASDEEPQSEDEKSSKDKKEKEEKEEKISGMRLENLNPSYYKKKSSNSSNSSNNKKIVENFDKNNKEESNNKSKSKPKNNEETFLGDVRKIVNDLDTGNNKMNANNAIKKISELMYNKHKTSIQQILNNADDDSDTEDDDKI
jgi:hypothetical protein